MFNITLGLLQITLRVTHAIHLLAFPIHWFIWSFQFQLWLILTPSSTSCSTDGSNTLLSKYLLFGFVLPMCITLHLLSVVLNFKSHWFCHSQSLLRYNWFLKYKLDLQYILTSSANKEILLFTQSGKSIIYSTNSKGPLVVHQM